MIAVARGRGRAHRTAADDATGNAAMLRLASHEIRTPLALARGYVDMIRSDTLGPVNDEVRDALGLVDQKLRQIDGLVGRMVEAARADAGNLELTRLDVADVLREAIDSLSDLAGTERRVVVSAPEEPAIVRADRFRLRVLLANLISNAIKYSPGGSEIRCTISVRRRRVEVAVADHGIGLRPEEARRLFQPFTRLPDGMRAARSGLGLGLHIARTIAKAHRGELRAAPNPGGGSVFTLSLPRAR